MLPFQLNHSVLQLLGNLFSFVDFFLIVSFAWVKQRVLEELKHFVELFIHAHNVTVDEVLELLWLFVGSLNCGHHFLVQLFYNQW